MMLGATFSLTFIWKQSIMAVAADIGKEWKVNELEERLCILGKK